MKKGVVIVPDFSHRNCKYFYLHYICPFYLILENNVDLNACYRSASFKEDEGTWKGNDDGKVVNNQPQRVMDDRNGLGPQSGYIARYVECRTPAALKSIVKKGI